MGPLTGLTVVELAGLGPAPFCGMILADLGAAVIRVDRTEDAAAARESGEGSADLLNRGKRSIAVDLKNASGTNVVLEILDRSDALIEGFRPGVAEKLGLGPEACWARNARLVYGRMTGWGQDGPYSAVPGHDLNYIALAGALDPIGHRGGPPVPPANLLGDFGGGGMLLALGVVCAVLEARQSGTGQVVDAAMVDGAALLTSGIHMLRATGRWNGDRGTNAFDGGAHFYNVYRCADAKYVTITATEPRFYANLLAALELDPEEYQQLDESRWPELTDKLAAMFRQRTRAEWQDRLGDAEVCFAPVLSPWEAHTDPHNAHRGTFTQTDGYLQPAPAPRFSRTPPEIQGPSPLPGEQTDEILAGIGFTHRQIAALRSDGAVA